MTRLVTITLNPAIDTSLEVDRVEPDRKLRTSAPRREPGGGGINVARVAARLGADCVALWSHGGVLGDLLRSLLDADGVPHQPVGIGGSTRENFVVGERSSDAQYRFTLPGPAFDADDAARWREVVAAADPAPEFLVLSGSLPSGVSDDFYAELVDAAPPSTRVVVDTHGEALERALASGVDLIKPNLRELQDLAGRVLPDDDAICAAARELIGAGRARILVVSLGRAGALLVTEDRCEHVRSPTVPIRSKVGAGDSTVAGIVTGLLRGLDDVDAVRLGVAAGAATVMSPGTALCQRDDVERLFEQAADAARR